MNKKMKSYLRSQFHAELSRNGKIDKAIDYLVQQTATQIFGEIYRTRTVGIDIKTRKKIGKLIQKVEFKWSF